MGQNKVSWQIVFCHFLDQSEAFSQKEAFVTQCPINGLLF